MNTQRILAFALVLAALATAAPAVRTQTPSQSPEPAAMRVYVDPLTGRLGTPPAAIAAARRIEPSDAASGRSHEGLVEVASPHAGGGILVDLQGRFHSHAVAVVGADGTIRTHCMAGPPPPRVP